MSSTSPTDSHLLGRRHGVPLLLSSFPVPPSHIPHTPMSGPFPSPFPSPLPSPNPPLSLPPSSPLPPVPGPSPVTEHETLMFISAARSRRSSKLSLASTTGSMYSRRDSTATMASLTSSSAPPLSPIMAHIDSSARSIRSFSSNGSLSHSTGRYLLEKSPMSEPRICEEDPSDLSHVSLTEITPPLVDVSVDGFSDTDENVLDVGLAPSFSRSRSGTHRAGPGTNDSISSIDMQDLPILQEDETEPLIVPPLQLASRVPPKPQTQLRSPPIKVRPRPPTAILNKDLPPLPVFETSGSPASGSSSQTTTKAALIPRDGAESPDIVSIIAATPRPRRKSSSQFSGRSRSRSRPNSTRRSVRRISNEVPVPVPSIDMHRSTGNTLSELAYTRRRTDDEDEDEDYGQVLDGTGTMMDLRMLDREIEARLERELEGLGSEDEIHSDGDSDSSIDVHTPLPSLMLREGMLSPHSKLLPQAVRAPSPHDRHLSVTSTTASIMTKSGIFRDQRDTQRRRVRHRDGSLLRAGMGLTTGLGWSDSEDEDAPSPLTRRISSLMVTRRTSSSSLSSSLRQSSRPAHPLSRSVSDGLSAASSALARHQLSSKESRPPMPPTSWMRTSTSSASSSRTSGTSMMHPGPSGRISSGSTAGARGSPLVHINEFNVDADTEREKDDFGMMTPSTASSSSLAMPLTPVGDDDSPSWSHGREKKSTSARRIPSSTNLKSALPFPRARTPSSSSIGSLSASIGHSQPTIPRPLRLPQTSTLKGKASQSSLRAPSSSLNTSTGNRIVSTPQTPQSTRSRTISGSRIAAPHLPTPPPVPTPRSVRTPVQSSSLPRTPVSRPMTPADRKPRTGTGMVYRTSASRPSVLRTPSSTLARSVPV